MLKNLCITSGAILSVAAATVAQTGSQVVLPAHSTVYNGFTRGYSFTAGSDFLIQDTELPPDAFQTGDTASVQIRVNGVEVMYDVGSAGPIVTPTAPIQVFTGDVVEVNGNWSPAATGNFTAHNSYATGGGTYSTPIEGVATTLFRAGVQWDIGDPGYTGATTFNAATGSMGRCFIYTTPLAGLFASFSATPSTGASPLTVTFTDTSFTSDPGGVLTWAWDFDNDGNIDSTNSTDTFTYAACGSYDVTLTVTDATNPASTTTVTGAVVVDEVQASFTVSNIAPGVWQFTDTSAPAPSAWAWDFDGDGTIDDTLQSPVYVDPSLSSLLSLPNCTLTTTGAGGCFTDTLVQSVFESSGGVATGETSGGNGTSATSTVGNYFDIQVANPEGLNILGLTTATYSFGGPMDVEVYLTSGTHVGKEGNPNAWMLAGSGSGVAQGGAAFTAPELVGIELDQPFYLPPGDYGVAVFLTDPAGGTMFVAYTNGPAASPYGNADLTIHPAGVGCAVTAGTLGGCAFSPRLWNGEFYYETCSASGFAAAGPYGEGCANSAGTSPSLLVNSMPVFGTNYELDLITGLAAPAAALIVIGDSKTIYNGLPLPLDLGVVGAPGCQLHTSYAAADLLIANPGAGNIWSFAIPATPALQCFTFYQQGAILDQAANGLGFVFSNANAAVVGG